MTAVSSTSTFPQINYPFVDERGQITQPWLQVLLALYNRTGGSQGNISTLLDTIDKNQGALLYRGPSVWEGLDAGTSGYVLETLGPDHDPMWALRVREVDTGIGLTGGPITDAGEIAMAQMAAQTLKGNASGATADPADLTPSEVKSFLDYIEVGDAAGGDLTGTYPDPTIGANKVDNTKLAQMPTLTLKGNNTGGTANSLDLTTAQVLSMLGAGAALGQPSFFAYLASNQSLTTATKIQFGSTVFNNGSYYDPTTNFRFTPLVAGSYWVSCQIRGTATSLSGVQALIYKNGATFDETTIRPNGTGDAATTVTALIQMNGSTDYLEGWASLAASSGSAVVGSATTPYHSTFQAFRVGP